MRLPQTESSLHGEHSRAASNNGRTSAFLEPKKLKYTLGTCRAPCSMAAKLGFGVIPCVLNCAHASVHSFATCSHVAVEIRRLSNSILNDQRLMPSMFLPTTEVKALLIDFSDKSMRRPGTYPSGRNQTHRGSYRQQQPAYCGDQPQNGNCNRQS